MAAQLIGCGLLYVAFGSTELQPWNSPSHTRVPQKGNSTLPVLLFSILKFRRISSDVLGF